MKILSAKTKILLGMIFTLMICLMFAGCSNSDTTSDSRGFTDFEHIEEEYLATIDSLDWQMELNFLKSWKMKIQGLLSKLAMVKQELLTCGNIHG